MTLDILFFALIAIFLGWRLYAVLGQRVGLDKSQASANPVQEAKPSRPPLPLRRKNVKINPALQPVIQAITKAEPDFDPDHFVEGAKNAYDMILQAFAEGDKATLRELLSPDLLRDFEKAIDDRQSQDQKLEFHLIGISEAELIDASLEKDLARIEIKFTSDHAQALYDKTGNLMEGDPKRIDTVTDYWRFTRQLGSSNPNWVLSETKHHE